MKKLWWSLHLLGLVTIATISAGLSLEAGGGRAGEAVQKCADCELPCCRNCTGHLMCNLCKYLVTAAAGAGECQCGGAENIINESEEPRSGSVSPGLGDLHRHSAADVELLGAERGGERGRDRNEEQAGERRKGGGPRRPQCRPSCCPRADCTKTTCPQCYARMVRSPATCPCVDIGGQQPDTPESSQLTVHRGGMDTLDTREFGEDTNTIRGSHDPAGDDAMKPQEQEAGGGATEGVPLCRPSCCPRADCTKTTCPSCYARMRKSPTLCPCVNTGQFSNRKYKRPNPLLDR